jgi:thiamine kinase-like enzyme
VILNVPDGEPAFHGRTAALCHWDLWPNNVLVDVRGVWWVLDWDGLAVGDPAEDVATLVWPLIYRTNTDWQNWVRGDEYDADTARRIDLHLRAISLDYVIDVLADWVECDVPEWQAEVRVQKELEHHAYLEWYRARWGCLS